MDTKCEADHLPDLVPKVKKDWSCTPTPSYVVTVWRVTKCEDDCTGRKYHCLKSVMFKGCGIAVLMLVVTGQEAQNCASSSCAISSK
jgi:hypothetical protein